MINELSKIEVNWKQFLENKAFPDFPLISGNSKVGFGLDLLHGSDWNKTSIVKARIDSLQKRETDLANRWLQALSVLGNKIVGSCEPTLIKKCFGFYLKEESSCNCKESSKIKEAKKKASKQGSCYCNGNQYIHSNPFKFFQSYARNMFFREHSKDAWKSVRNFILGNNYSFPRQLFRLFGQGDLEASQVNNFIEVMKDVKHLVSGFVRRPSIWKILLENGFFTIAHSVDRTLVERKYHFEAIKEVKKVYGRKAVVVLAPFDAHEMCEHDKKDFMNFLGDFRFDVVIEQHHGGRIKKETIDFTNNNKIAIWKCPTTHDKMSKKDKVRVCFSGCTRCHLGKGLSEASFAV